MAHDDTPMRAVLRNMLQYGHLSFRDFVEVALYHPEFGYYSRPTSPVGRAGDYITSPSLSPVFAFALSRLVREFMSRCEGEVCTIVDIGCGDGGLIRGLADSAQLTADREASGLSAVSGPLSARFIGIDRSLDRAIPHPQVTYLRTIDELPQGGCHLIISNELFDALPFARLVMRGGHLHELYVDGTFDWAEEEAMGPYEHYFAERGIDLAEGQFADVSLEWEATYRDIARVVERGLIVTFDYGYPAKKLFHPRARRFGTAAAYANHQVTRDLLANPGEQDITAHINFDDLIAAGESLGFSTRFFDVQSKFLLTLGITEHPLFAPVTDVTIDTVHEGVELLESRDEARRLILPDGIGHDIRVLAQSREMGEEAWSFERRLF